MALAFFVWSQFYSLLTDNSRRHQALSNLVPPVKIIYRINRLLWEQVIGQDAPSNAGIIEVVAAVIVKIPTQAIGVKTRWIARTAIPVYPVGPITMIMAIADMTIIIINHTHSAIAWGPTVAINQVAIDLRMTTTANALTGMARINHIVFIGLLLLATTIHQLDTGAIVCRAVEGSSPASDVITPHLSHAFARRTVRAGYLVEIDIIKDGHRRLIIKVIDSVIAHFVTAPG